MILICVIFWPLLIITVHGEKYSQENVAVDQPAENLGCKRVSKPEKLTLKVKINGESNVIKLVPTSQLLANEHLPVWVSSNSQNGQFQKLHDIMKEDVGDFTMYHDYCTRSAVIYFHKRGELDGVIKAKYKIEGLSVDALDEEHTITSGYFSFLKVGKYFRRLCGSNNQPTGIETLRNPKIKVYPELLIAISHDMFQDIEKKSKFPRGVKTIFHVLTVYNVADMLFRYVKSAEISLNIAGIVIEGNENEWGFVTKTSGYSYVDANKINDQVSEYFRRREHHFLRHSYDYIAYNTRRKLLLSKQIPLLGIAVPAGYTQMLYPFIYRYRYNFAVVDFNSLAHYTTIVHELAHVFGAKHDRAVNWFFHPSCDRSVMAKFDCSSQICLKWSDKTEKQMGQYFRSPAHCILRNEPRSLSPPNPRQMLTGLEQCQCYGYESYVESDNFSPEKGCYTGITCADADGILNNHLPFPMDGTPCGTGTKSVCWDEECRSIKNEKTSA